MLQNVKQSMTSWRQRMKYKYYDCSLTFLARIRLFISELCRDLRCAVTPVLSNTRHAYDVITYHSDESAQRSVGMEASKSFYVALEELDYVKLLKFSHFIAIRTFVLLSWM